METYAPHKVAPSSLRDRSRCWAADTLLHSGTATNTPLKAGKQMRESQRPIFILHMSDLFCRDTGHENRLTIKLKTSCINTKAMLTPVAYFLPYYPKAPKGTCWCQHVNRNVQKPACIQSKKWPPPFCFYDYLRSYTISGCV